MNQKNCTKQYYHIIFISIILINSFSPIILAAEDDFVSINFLPRKNEPPYKPINVYPPDGSLNIKTPVTLQVLVFDNTTSQIDVYFYNAANNSLIGVNYNVTSGDTTSMLWSNLEKGRIYTWYAVAQDFEFLNQSDTWSFATRPNQPPIIHNNEYPPNTSTDIELRPNCHIQISDDDSDNMTLYWYAKINSNWVLQQKDENLINGTYYWRYYEAELYQTTFYWKVAVNDSIDNTTAIFYFKTKRSGSSGGGGAPPPPPITPDEENKEPIAIITGPETGILNQTILFGAYYSYDIDGYITGYRWDFNNDGVYDTEWMEDVFAEYTFTEPGNHTVKLQVKDNDGNTSTDTVIITITKIQEDQQPPIAQANGPYHGKIKQEIYFDSSGSYDPDGTIINYIWDFGDMNTSNMQNPTHEYTTPGEYIIVLTVIDNDNLVDIDIATVYITGNETKKPDTIPEDQIRQPLMILIIILLAIIITVLILTLLQREHKKDTSSNNSSKTTIFSSLVNKLRQLVKYPNYKLKSHRKGKSKRFAQMKKYKIKNSKTNNTQKFIYKKKTHTQISRFHLF